jgi:protein O-mannosyl-transferase
MEYMTKFFNIFEKNRMLLAFLFFVVTIVLVYGQVKDFDFINLDDNYYVIENIHIRNGFTYEGIKWAFTNMEVGQYIPLVWLSYMLDTQLCGLAPGWFHITNLFFHILNVLLLFYLFIILSDNFWISFFIAAFLAFHPMHVESVVWITERKDVLSMFFFLLALITYSRYSNNHSPWSYSGSFALFLLGISTKPMLITFPAILLLLDYWPFNKTKEQKITPQKLIYEKAPFILISIFIGVLTLYGTHQSGGITSLAEIPLTSRLSNMFVSYMAYLIKLLWPVKLAVVYPYPDSFSFYSIMVSFSLIISITIFSFVNIKKKPYLFIGWAWYLIILFPVIGLAQAGAQSMADRFAYMPFIGLYSLFSWGIADLYKAGYIKKWLCIGSSVLIVFLLVLQSHKQVKFWKNSITLFEHSIHVTENNYTAYFNLGDALQKEGRLSEAIINYEKALSVRPYDINILSHMGLALLKTGELDAAVTILKQAINIKPHHLEAINNLGIAYYKKEEYDRALFYFNEALIKDPDYQHAKTNREILLESIEK